MKRTVVDTMSVQWGLRIAWDLPSLQLALRGDGVWF
jgi:hypothetical protein